MKQSIIIFIITMVTSIVGNPVYAQLYEFVQYRNCGSKN